MAQHKAGPYTLTYPMIFNGLTHDLEVNCDVIGTAETGDAPDDVTLRTRSGVGADLDASANAFWGVVRGFFNGLTLCSTYNLWKRNENNDDRLFISGGTLTNPNGSNPTANTAAGQIILTWRTGGGNVMRLSLQEPVVPNNDRVPIASSFDPNTIAVNGFIMSGLNFVMARDRSFPVAPMNQSFGQNEVTFKRRYRG